MLRTSTAALSVIWIIDASINTHQIGLYDDYCAYYAFKGYTNDVCDTIIRQSKTTRTLAIIEAVVSACSLPEHD